MVLRRLRMKKNVIFVFALILMAFSCSTTPPTVKEGAKLFNEQKYAEAIKVFEKVIEKDPKNANAAYNIAISYIQLKDDDNALIYLNKATDINKFYYDAWYNMAILEFNKGEYKKAVMASLTAGQEGRKIIYKYFLKLKETGFPNRDYAQLIEKDVLPLGDFVIDTDSKKIYFTLSVSKNGKVNKVSCGHNEKTDDDPIEKKVCEFYLPFLLSLEFIPAYDFYKNEMKSSEEIGFITLNKEKDLGANLCILDEYKNTHLKTAEKSNTLDKSVSNTSTKTATSKKPEILNILSKSVIDVSINKNMSEIKSCYEEELLKNYNLYGKIEIIFIIDNDGTVPVAKVSKTSIHDKNVEVCVKDQIKKVRFPAPGGDGVIIVNYHFVFKHSEE